MDPNSERRIYESVAAEFGWLTIEEVGVRCHVSMEGPMRTIQLNKWELWIESDAGPLYPGFFLTDQTEFGYVVAETPEAALHLLRTISPACSIWQVIEWLITPHQQLDGIRPIDVDEHQAWKTFRSILGLGQPSWRF